MATVALGDVGGSGGRPVCRTVGAESTGVWYCLIQCSRYLGAFPNDALHRAWGESVKEKGCMCIRCVHRDTAASV